MKLHLTRPGGQNMITGYGDGYVAVNTERYTRPVIVAPDRAVAEWDVRDFSSLEPSHFQALLELKPKIVLLGTGERQQFPRPELMRIFTDAGVGLEVMDTKAACRTYNILMSEDREVIAAILV